MASCTCLMLPFVRTGMTEEYANKPIVFERWQPRMLERFEAARAVTRLLGQPANELDLGNYELLVGETPEAAQMRWAGVELQVKEANLGWSKSEKL